MPAPDATKNGALRSRRSFSWLLAGAGLAVALLVVDVVLTLRNTSRLNEDAAWVARTHEIMASLESVLSLVKDAETGTRGFVITGEPRYLEPHIAAIAAIDQEVVELERLTAHDPDIQAHLPELRKRVATRLQILEEVLTLRKSAGFEAARQAIASGRSKQEMDALRGVVAEMREHEQGLLRERSRTSARTYRAAILTGFLSGLSALVAVCAFSMLMWWHLAERTRAAAVLAEHGERLRTTLASIGDAVITTDTAGRITNMNAMAESLTGWQSGYAAGEPLDAVFRIVNEETRQPVPNPATRALTEGVIVGLSSHTILIAKDGTERPIDDSAAPIRRQEGEIVGCVLVFRDVTEQRRAVRVLQESEARKAAIFETALDCIISIDHEGTIIEFNAAAERTFGHQREDVLGRELAEVIIPLAYRKPHRKGLARYLTTGEGPVLNQRLELSALRADGTEFPVELTVTRIPVNGPPQFTAYLRDITKRKRAVAELRESEQRFRILFDLGPVAIFSCDREGVVQNYNRRAAELWGREPKCGDISEKYCGSLQLYHPDGRLLPHAESPIIEVLRTGVTVRDAEVLIQRPDGSRISVLVTFSPLETELGEISGAITAFYDITERKRLENELRKVAVELSEADHRKDEFLAMLAHELRNPLAPIRNAVQIVKLAKGNEAAVQSAAEAIERQVNHMVRLVDDLLDVNRISRGKIELRLERVALASVIEQAIETSRPMIDAAGHELSVSLPPQPIYLHADGVRLAQVFSNLLNNSCKYSEREGRISLAAERKGSDVLVSVKDTGVGIPAAMLPKVFEMFTQVDRSLERSQGGLGIGLSLVKSLVQMHGGSVEVFSEGPGHGSTFIVRLPVMASGGRLASETQPPDTSHQPAQYQGADAPRSPHRRILVVDDNRDSAQTLAMLLKITGNETRLAHDGLEAVAAATEFRPEVVLLDIGLPKLNGYEVARKIREQPWGESMVLVALTGWGQDEDRQKSKDAGFNGHMVKPVDYAALMKLLAELLAMPA